MQWNHSWKLDADDKKENKSKVAKAARKDAAIYYEPSSHSFQITLNEYDCDNADTIVTSNPFPRFEHRVNDN